MGGETNDGILPEEIPTVGYGNIVLAHMDAIGFDVNGELWVVIHNEWDTEVGAEATQLHRLFPVGLGRSMFFSQLHDIDTTRNAVSDKGVEIIAEWGTQIQ